MADITGESTVAVEGAAATDAAASGNPVLIGGKGTVSTVFPTAMSADGDAVPVATDRRGRVFVVPVPPYEASPTIVSVNFETSTDLADIVAAPGASKSIRVLGYTLQANSGTAEVRFVDDTATPVVLSQKWLLAAREGVVVMAPAGAFIFDCGANKKLRLDFTVGGGTVTVCGQVIYTTVNHT